MDNKQQLPVSHALAPAYHFGFFPTLATPDYGYHGNPAPSLLAAPKSGFHGNAGSLSSQPDAYMQGSEVGQNAARNPAVLLVSYPCLFPRCEAQFPHEALLEQHMARHFEPNLENRSAGGTLFRPSNMNSSELNGPIDCSSGFAPSAGPSFRQMGNDLYCQTTQHDSTVASNSSAMRTSSTANATYAANATKKYPCRDLTCKEGFNRWADRKRHEKTHYTTGKVKVFECPELGCNRTGEWGFSRRDKIVDHIRAKHKRSVGRDEFRSGNSLPTEEWRKWLKANGKDSWDDYYFY